MKQRIASSTAAGLARAALSLAAVLMLASPRSPPPPGIPVATDRGPVHAIAATRPIPPPDVTAFVPYPAIPGPAARDHARLVNAAVPFSTIPDTMARPFVLPPGTLDLDRAIDCLAAAAYYEAGDDPVGARAVVQVVLNRVRHPAFPSTVCGVVLQGAERATGCQFTFTCDGALSRTPPVAAWRRARLTALQALAGRVDPTVGHATHYHTDYVHPRWSTSLDKVAAVDTHLFFRWPGRSGRAAAFAQAYAGMEPAGARLAHLSPAHRTVIPAMADKTIDALLPPPPPLADVAERLPDVTRPPDPDTFLVTVAGGGDGGGLVAMAQRLCAGRDYCKVIGWDDARHTPSHLPMSGSAIDAMSFSYTRPSAASQGRAMWNCRDFLRADPAQCLHRGPV